MLTKFAIYYTIGIFFTQKVDQIQWYFICQYFEKMCHCWNI